MIKYIYSCLNTPSVILNMEKMEANIKEMTQLSVDAGVKLRPHTKVHESADIAKLQIKAGACGIEVGNVNQAEAMAENGIDDIIIAHPFYGEHKLKILGRLLKKPRLKIAVVVDMLEQAKGISQLGEAVNRKVPVLIKIETGGDRYGVLPGKPTLKLAKKLSHLQGIEVVGIYGHEMGAKPTPDGVDELALKVLTMMTETASMMRRQDIKIDHVSVGASPTFRATCRYIKEGKFPEVTEIHPGQCVLGDIMCKRNFSIIEDRCALTVLTTVVSTSHSTHAVIDAGSKTFGANSLIAYWQAPDFFWRGNPSFGSIQGRPDLWFGRLSAETSVIYYKDAKRKLNLGERLEIIPNDAQIVISIHDQVYGVRNGVVEREFLVTGRGHGN